MSMSGHVKGQQGPTAKAVVVGKDSEGHDKDVIAQGVNIPQGASLQDKMGDRNVEVEVTGIKKGTADTVRAVGFDFS